MWQKLGERGLYGSLLDAVDTAGDWTHRQARAHNRASASFPPPVLTLAGPSSAQICDGASTIKSRVLDDSYRPRPHAASSSNEPLSDPASDASSSDEPMSEENEPMSDAPTGIERLSPSPPGPPLAEAVEPAPIRRRESNGAGLKPAPPQRK